MQRLHQKLIRFSRDESGLTLVEYAVAAGLITTALVAALTAVGLTVNSIITNVNDFIVS